jgi:hypothetical protein
VSEPTPPETPAAAAEEESSPVVVGLILLFTVAVIGGVLFSLATFALPPLVHAMDSGHATHDVAEIVPGFAPASRNLTLKGRSLMDVNVARNVRSRGSAGTTSVFYPLVPAAWKPDQPVRVIASAAEFTNEQLKAIAGSAEVKGVLATAPLESIVFGIPDDVRSYLKTKHKLTIADDAVLFRVSK